MTDLLPWLILAGLGLMFWRDVLSRARTALGDVATLGQRAKGAVSSWYAALLIGVIIGTFVPQGLAWVRANGWQWPMIPRSRAACPAQVTAVVYTYDDTTPIPPAVESAISKLNAQGILTTKDEVDTDTPDGNVPAQYRVSRPTAKAVGLPALVVLSGEAVIRVVKDPRTEAAVTEAVK